MKLGVVAKEAIFMKTVMDNFTPFYEPLVPLLNELRQIVFPKDKPWQREDQKLYSRMREILGLALAGYYTRLVLTQWLLYMATLTVSHRLRKPLVQMEICTLN